MSGTIDDRYFEWLYELVGSVRNRNPARSYWNLYRLLYTTEFVWLIPNDDNRVEDGRELRYEFIEETWTDEVDANWSDLGCSIFEMLLALSRRASFESDMEPAWWFRHFLENMGIEVYNDAVWNTFAFDDVTIALAKFVYRNYEKNGVGGVFPLVHTRKDQRRVELWYQMAEDIQEKFPP